MLHAFIARHRDQIIARARARVLLRRVPRPTESEIDRGVPLFLTQIHELLGAELTRAHVHTVHEQIEESARTHGLDLLGQGFTVAQVVHGYGDVCQVVTELASEERAPIGPTEWRILNGCLDIAIAAAVSEYARARERAIADAGTERLGVLAHELRNTLSTAILSFDAIRQGSVGVTGSVGTIHGRSLLTLRDLIDRSLTEVRLQARIVRREPLAVAELIEDAEVGAAMEARAKDVELVVAPVSRDIRVTADRQVLGSALTNLLQNAIKFTRGRGRVSLSTETSESTVKIHVADQCGGLPEGRAESLFKPFEQGDADRSGLGLGLSIAERATRANGGDLRVTNFPGEGCRFTLELPRLQAS